MNANFDQLRHSTTLRFIPIIIMYQYYC